MSGALRIDRVVTSGTFSLDGGTWDVDNNVWVIGDDDEVVIVDAAHSASQIVDAVAGRNVVAVVVTHGHDDHVTVAPELAITLHAGVLHPGDDMLWKASHPENGIGTSTPGGASTSRAPDRGHPPPGSAGSGVLPSCRRRGVPFSGDTCSTVGGRPAVPTATSPIIDLIRETLFVLPEDTRVHTGHGEHTTIGAEAPHLAEWIARGR